MLLLGGDGRINVIFIPKKPREKTKSTGKTSGILSLIMCVNPDDSPNKGVMLLSSLTVMKFNIDQLLQYYCAA